MIDAIYIHLFEIIKNTVTIDCLSFGSMDGVWMENMHRRVCMLLCSRSMYLVLLLMLTLPRVMSNRRQAEEFNPSQRFNTDRQHSQIISTILMSVHRDAVFCHPRCSQVAKLDHFAESHPMNRNRHCRVLQRPSASPLVLCCEKQRGCQRYADHGTEIIGSRRLA
jgi:hypothetical protein